MNPNLFPAENEVLNRLMEFPEAERLNVAAVKIACLEAELARQHAAAKRRAIVDADGKLARRETSRDREHVHA